MTRKRKRRSSVVENGTGPARVKIYTVKRKDGYDVLLEMRHNDNSAINNLEGGEPVARKDSVKICILTSFSSLTKQNI